MKILGLILIVAACLVPVAVQAEVGWANYQWPCYGASYADNQNIDIYSQAWKPGCTEPPGPCPGLEAWLFFRRADEPFDMQMPMTFNVQVGNNDEYTAQIPAEHTQAGIPELYYIRYHDLTDDTWYDPSDHCGGGTPPPMVLNITPATSHDVTVVFQVNMSCLPPEQYSGGVFFAGDFTGWSSCWPGAQMMDPDNDLIFEGQWFFPAGSNPAHEFKFNRQGTDGCNWESSIPNRAFTLDETQPVQILPTVRWDNWTCLTPCPCPNPEQEPNNEFPVAQTINLGEEFCGVIDAPGDMDLVRVNQPMAAAVRLTLLGNAGPEPCPGGQGLHPCAQILSEDNGSVIAYAGDTTNQATYFETTFPIGGYPHIIRIAGANGTVGPYVMRLDPAEVPAVAPPEPQLTVNTVGGVTQLNWNASYLPSEYITIDDAVTPDGPWYTFAVIFGTQHSIPIPTSAGHRFFRATASGSRPQSPFVGAIIPLSEPGANEYEDNEVGQFQIMEIEWGRDANGRVGMTRLVAQGVGPSIGEYIDQDNRDLYLQGLTPIVDFAGTNLNIFGRDISIQHCAFVRDPLTNTISIADGRGWNPSGDSLMYFNESPQYMTSNLGVSGIWIGWPWWDWCPDFCCHLKVIAFCRATWLAWNAACAGWTCPGNPACWLGCPCPPTAGPLCVLPPPVGCSACAIVPDPNFALRRWCTCGAQQPPGGSPFCFFQIWVKCKYYECWDTFIDCDCPGAPPCPIFPNWTVVPFVNSALRAACRVDCLP